MENENTYLKQKYDPISYINNKVPYNAQDHHIAMGLQALQIDHQFYQETADKIWSLLNDLEFAHDVYEEGEITCIKVRLYNALKNLDNSWLALHDEINDTLSSMKLRRERNKGE